MKKLFNLLILILCVSFSAFSQAGNPEVIGSNPYEYVGVNHNSILQSFYTDYTKERVLVERLTIDALNNYVMQKSNLQEVAVGNDILNNNTFRNIKSASLSDIPVLLQQSNIISAKCADYMKLIPSMINNVGDDGVDSLNNKLISLENNVLQDQNLSETEKGILLSSIATGRYSAYFWAEMAESMDTKTKGSNADRKLPGWLQDLISADVSGGVAGGVIGAMIGGTATLGALTVPAWVAGALTGGAGNSIQSGIQSLWNWIF